MSSGTQVDLDWAGMDAGPKLHLVRTARGQEHRLRLRLRRPR